MVGVANDKQRKLTMKTEKKAIVLKTVDEARAYLKKLSVKAAQVEKRLDKSIPEKDDIDLGNPNVDDPKQLEKEFKKFDKGMAKFNKQFDKAMSAFSAADELIAEYKRVIGQYPELRKEFKEVFE